MVNSCYHVAYLVCYALLTIKHWANYQHWKEGLKINSPPPSLDSATSKSYHPYSACYFIDFTPLIILPNLSNCTPQHWRRTGTFLVPFLKFNYTIFLAKFVKNLWNWVRVRFYRPAGERRAKLRTSILAQLPPSSSSPYNFILQRRKI